MSKILLKPTVAIFRRHGVVATVAALAAALLPAPSVQAADANNIETMVVTGVRGRERSVTNSPVPIDVISSAQLESAGAFGGEFGQALQTLVPSFNQQRQSNSGFADIVRPAQLRGMSPDQTLVLVNGKRRHTTSVTGTDAKTGRGTAPVDFNAIPTNAISRIEVLRDGAGSQYGSDAIAGVINVILDDRAEGVDLNFTYGSHATEFEPTDDDITDGETKALQFSFGLPIDSGGFFRAGMEYRDREQTNRAGFDQVPFFEDEANIDLVGGQRNFRPGDGASEDIYLWFNTAIDLNANTEFYTFATYDQRDAEGTGFFRYPISSTNILTEYPLGYRPITTGDSSDIGLTTGIRGAVGDWNWDGSVSYGRNSFDSGVKNSLNPSLGPGTQRSFDSGSSENDLWSVNFDVNRPLNLGFTQPATLALGVEYREQGFASKAGETASFIAGPFADDPDFLAIGAQAGGGLRPEEERDLEREVVSLYAELSADVTDALFFDVSARYEDSDDFGHTTSGKLAARWEFVEGVALRGAISNSFRAPSLVQLGFGQSSTSFGEGGRLTTVNTLPVDDAVAIALGAQELEEETSNNFSLGLTAELFEGFVLTIDAFRIDVDDRITLSERIDCEDAPAAALALCNARNIVSANFFTNAVDTRTEGFDLVATYTADLAGGSLNLSAAYANAETDVEDVNNPALSGVVLVGVEERNTIEDAAPDERIVLAANWSNDRFSGLGRLTYHGETTRVFNFGDGFEPEQTYDGTWQFDAEVAYRFIDQIEIFVGGSNLFDEYPDESNELIFFFGNLPYDVLSPIGMNGRFIYGGARMSF